MEGNVLVDGVLASCYAAADHDLAHLAVTPLRWFPEIMKWIFGAENEISVYVQISQDLGRWVVPFDL